MEQRPPGLERTLLKEDALGRVELLRCGDERRVRRVACGGRVPLSGWLARRLLARERRALLALAGLEGVPALETQPSWSADPPGSGATLVRAYLDGLPLHRATHLPEDFFERLEELVLELHARGVCHNDLHKEQNVVVARDGRPALIDFQLSSVHARRGRTFTSRAHDDLRHVEKHHRRYTRAGRGPGGSSDRDPRPRRRRSLPAALWRRLAKPLYNLATRRLFDLRDGEERRASGGPWPLWTPPVGPRKGARD